MKADKYFVSIDSSVETFTQKIKSPSFSTQGTFTKVDKSLYSMKLDKAVALKHLDKFPVSQGDEELEVTVLFPISEKYNKRRMKRAVSILKPSINNNISDLIESVFEIEPAPVFANYLDFLCKIEDELLPVLEDLQLKGKLKIIEYTSLSVISSSFLTSLLDQIKAKMKESIDSSRRSLPCEELFRSLSYSPSRLLASYLLQQLQTEIPHTIADSKLHFQNPSINSKDKKLIKKITDILEAANKPIVNFDTLADKTKLPFNELNDALWYLINEGTVTQLNPQAVILTEFLTKLTNKLKKYKRNYGDNIDINAFRNQTSLNREQIISVFEYFDSQGITSRIGNIRRILLTV